MMTARLAVETPETGSRETDIENSKEIKDYEKHYWKPLRPH